VPATPTGLPGGQTAREPKDRAAARADDGLFGPESVTWRVMSEPVMWVAGFRAFYLQALHPRVMRGTWQNTVFTDPKQVWGRFARTTEFVRVRTFGSLAEVDRAARRVRKIHAYLSGCDEEGRRFRLDEPELLLWVHCSEISSYADVARRSGVPLTPRELDTFVDEQRRSAAVVGLDPAAVPASVAGLDQYFGSMRARLRVTPEARRAVLRSFNPALPMPWLPLKLLVPGIAALAYASLPRWARRRYGIPASPLNEGTRGTPGRLLVAPAARATSAGVQAVQRARRGLLAGTSAAS